MKVKFSILIAFMFLAPFLLFSQGITNDQITENWLRNVLIGGLGTIIVVILKLYIDTKDKQIERLEEMQERQIETNKTMSTAVTELKEEFKAFKEMCDWKHSKK